MSEDKTTVLVMDDEAIFREALSLYLEGQGFRVLQAENGRQGLNIFRAERPDMVLIDLSMPELNGLDVLTGIHELDPETPVIIISGTGVLQDAITAIRHGAWDYVSKPILDMALLDHVMNNVLERVRLFKQNKRYQNELESEIEKRTAQLQRAHEQLEEQNAFLSTLIESMPSPVFYKDTQGRFLGCSKSFAGLFGLQAEAIVGHASEMMFPRKQAELIKCTDKKALATSGPVTFETSLTAPDGTMTHMSIRKTIFKDRQGQVAGLVGVYNDITEHKLLEERLRESETRHRLLLESLSNGIVEIDVKGTILFANPALEEICGYTPGEMVGASVLDLAVDEEDRALINSMLAHQIGIRPRLCSIQVKRRRKDGNIIDVQMDWSCAHGDGAEVKTYIASVTDITARKRAAEELKQSEETLRAILLGIKAGIIVIDTETYTVMDMNPVAENITGISREEVIGKSCKYIKWRNSRTNEVVDACSIESGTLINEEFRVERPDGKIVPITKTVVPAMRGQRKLNYEIIFDFTERKALERQLVVAQRLESIGQLASGIAHEINTPIQYVGDNLSFLDTAFAELTAATRCTENISSPGQPSSKDQDLSFMLEEIPKALAQSSEGVARVASIVQAMKRFSHPGNDEKMLLDVNKAIENTVTVARNEWKYHAEVELDLDHEAQSLLCFAGDFNQVLLNMLVNAAHAVSEKFKDSTDKGLICIRTKREAQFLTVTIADNGTGIPEKNLQRIYDPFFTTKEVGKGTGQGLAIVHDIVVNKHGGSVEVESELGKGTTFVLRFPLSENTGVTV